MSFILEIHISLIHDKVILDPNVKQNTNRYYFSFAHLPAYQTDRFNFVLSILCYITLLLLRCLYKKDVLMK